jgi:tricorn protease interacting factor F2/3
MSTYLVFFGVGEFEFTHDEKDDRVRVATLPGMQAFAHFGADLGRKSLEFSESYYGIAYPLPKMDLIAIPDFAFGAMENWGAITFRENLLLHYPDVTSKSGEERIFEVIAHEIAHQWFGNLVTPSDWKYLWLNESFATFFGFGVVDHYCPDWDTWQQFLYSMTGPALTRDALHETFAIEIPGGEHVVINSSTAPIIYNKGGSILRQIRGYIGEDSFKQGLQHYLKTYEYDCAASSRVIRKSPSAAKTAD